MNPKFDFYSKLLSLVKKPEFAKKLAEEIVQIYESHPGEISLPDVTFQNLERFHECYHRDAEPGKTITMGQWLEGFDIFEEISKHLFEDLVTQMRSGAVRKLHHKWKERAGIPNDLFVCIRRSTDLGDGVTVLTVLTDDPVKFKHYYEDPQKVLFSGEVHFSEVDESKEPAQS